MLTSATMIEHAQGRVETWRDRRRAAGALFVGLDFDGTLAPIVERPEDAALLPESREALVRLAARADTDVAIVSGRGLADVRERVGLEGLYYAGNHGLEIQGPGLERLHPEAEAAQSVLRRCAAALTEALAGDPGVQVEDKGLTLSVHYRRAEREGAGARVRAAVSAACGGESLRVTEGKKVLEIRPDVDWDKGRATSFLLEAIEGADADVIPALFVGDDTTDEDAFRALAGRGDGVVVGTSPPAGTAATAFVRSPEEVAELIRGLADG